MSFTSIFIALLYLGGFLIILVTASAVILPLLITSLFFATGVVLCGFLSNKSYKLALRAYNLATPHTRSSLQAAADHLAPLDSVETVSPKEELLHKIHHFYKKSDSNVRTPIVVSGSEIPKSVIKVSEGT
ncbi:Ldo16p [Lachancea thermotolerans CBS 6340]|uniref:Outer spore wall protein 5 n=1 Tax=Lachancea thermotolerans (strain ATCC 56472 / CBS 6340 / NRRL Y-8284) TaxID=559295 RepID=OSW5_LACTC|nr:KLTH0H15840p [Lachancea thermotolerans CBS 6340]C5E3S0.1 RecName: Full=Outer spore wall protein 5 [Lachancea thermotolerans CBS 6340]CAR30681.1 KLTH0H15840p [Lachancea thermotolerans CBS 6340]